MIVFTYLQELFREEIADQIKEVKDIWYADKEYGEHAQYVEHVKYVRCSITGLLIPRWMCDADHYEPSFVKLVYDFLKTGFPFGIFQHPYVHPQDLIIEGSYHVPENEECLDELLKRWSVYHKENAKLRPVYSKVNRRRCKDDMNWESLIPSYVKRINWSGFSMDDIKFKMSCKEEKFSSELQDEYYSKGILVVNEKRD